MAERTEPIELLEMVHGGNALAKVDGRAIFVTGGLPGEQVRVTITRDQDSYAFAVVDAVLEASPHRVAPRCPYFRAGTCGGCQWQHIEYATQLEFKTSIVSEQFRRIGKFDAAPIRPMIASPEPWFYRTHVTFHRAANGEYGFVAPDDRTVTPVDECCIIRPELLALKSAITNGGKRARCMVGTDGVETTIVAGDEPPPAASPARGEQVHFTIRGETFQVNQNSFFQVNVAQAAVLVDLVLEHLALTGDERVLDLYAGVGLFSLFVARRARRVTLIEISRSAIYDARKNLAQFTHVEYIEAAVEQALPRFKRKIDAAVIDPPRAGMKAGALAALIALAPRKIAYVSCDPATLARDARALVDAGYALTSVQPVDMFPQTYHIECVAGFERRAP